MVNRTKIIIIMVSCSALYAVQARALVATLNNDFSTGSFRWFAGPPVLEPIEVDGEKWISVKDPSIVRYKGRWHLFCTVRGLKRSHAIIYLTFENWPQAKTTPQQVLKCHPGYFCAPHVFYFTPHKKWYLICQASDDTWEPKYQPAFSSTTDITSPDSWSSLTPLFKTKPANINAWLDFWVICDDAKAHLFFTSLNGKMWRAETTLAQFPAGWSTPVLALEADVFEASHTYRLKGSNKYLTLIEAQNGHGWRYYKAYLADRLDGVWTPLAAGKEKSFASMLNVRHPSERWTDVISHGELLRAGYNEKLEVDPDNLRFLFQGVADPQRLRKSYGRIPWRLGILEPAPKTAAISEIHPKPPR
ncbi:MAG: alpha-L-arabinofuranosidase [Planctomycetes bacterium]|nr:alpha-L-arabinofuranosidase [Planctomycetota bacterium]